MLTVNLLLTQSLHYIRAISSVMDLSMYFQLGQDVAAEAEEEVAEEATEAEEAVVMEEIEREVTMISHVTIVIKPAISAGTAQTMRVEAEAAATDAAVVAITGAVMTEHAITVAKKVIYRTIAHKVVAVVEEEMVAVAAGAAAETAAEVEGGIEMPVVETTIERRKSPGASDTNLKGMPYEHAHEINRLGSL